MVKKPPINRRKLLKSAAASSTVAVIPGMASASDSGFRLSAKYSLTKTILVSGEKKSEVNREIQSEVVARRKGELKIKSEEFDGGDLKSEGEYWVKQSSIVAPSFKDTSQNGASKRQREVVEDSGWVRVIRVSTGSEDGMQQEIEIQLEDYDGSGYSENSNGRANGYWLLPTLFPLINGGCSAE